MHRHYRRPGRDEVGVRFKGLDAEPQREPEGGLCGNQEDGKQTAKDTQ